MTDGRSDGKPVRLLLAGAQPLLRSGLRSVLASEPDLDVVAEAADGAEAVDLARRLLPDVVIMDLRMPRLDGVAATGAIVHARLPVQVLLLTSSERDEHLIGALRAGARGFLRKDVSEAELVDGIRTVAAGGAVASPAILDRLLDRLVSLLPPAEPAAASGLKPLTDREREVLAHVARGATNSEIARALSVSETTIKTHVGNLLSKLGLRDRVQAVVFAYEAGVVHPGR